MMIKICGITRVEDAQRAADLGATAVGFVFWPRSPRAIAPDAARRIGATLPAHVERVGVFVDATATEVDAIADEAALTTVQLQGDESVDAVRSLSARWPVIRAIGLTAEVTPATLDAWRDVRVLLDAHDPVNRGGTGRTVDWDRAAAIASRHAIILAGGLTPRNVADAVARVRPAGVDVSSGVEVAPGVKDPDKLRAFFDALAQVEAWHGER
jgi:phosphoribosylanthranilate isomerase